MLNPARFSSSAMVAVPPDDDDAFVDAPLVVPAPAQRTERLSAPTARRRQADRFTIPLESHSLPLTVGRPGDGRIPAFSSTHLCRKMFAKRNAIATFVLVMPSRIPVGNAAEESSDPVSIGAIAHDSCVRAHVDAVGQESEYQLRAHCVVGDNGPVKIQREAMVYVLAVAAALSNALTSVFQRMGVEDAPEESTMRLSLLAHAVRRGVWLLGFGFMICSFLLQSFALHIGRLSVVQPILTMELLFLVAILGTYFRFSISLREWIGASRHRLRALRLPLLRRSGRRRPRCPPTSVGSWSAAPPSS